MKLLDRISVWWLAVLALVMGIAPFGGKPHLVEKLQMLVAGMLTRPIDIFDLFLHGILPLLLFIKLVRMGWLQYLSQKEK